MLHPDRSVPDGVWCAIPVYNNAGTIRQVATGCREVLPGVVVIDDGSTDADLRDLLRDLDVVILRHERNLGKGAALLTGLRYVRERLGRTMIAIDGDGQHDPADLRAFLREIPDDDGVLLIGRRNMEGPNVPASSRFGMVFSNFWVRLETGQVCPDTQSGFRAYPVEPLGKLRFLSRRYSFEIEVLARAAWGGIELRSIDVAVHYPRPGERVSSFRPIVDNVRLSMIHSFLILRRLLPWPHRRLVEDRKPPRVSFWRQPGAFIRQLFREHATPAGLGVAAGVGVLLGALPLVACHTVAIVYVTARLNLNVPVAVAAQNLCAPPLVPFLCVELGHYLLHGRWLAEFSLQTVVHEMLDRLLEWLLGSLLLAPVLGAVAGAVVFLVARAIQGGADRA